MKHVRIFVLILLALGAASSLVAQDFQKDFSNAKKLSKETGKPLVILFTGSDWCPPCKRLHSLVYHNAAFQQYANENLIMYYADFPRRPENQLPAETKAVNDALSKEFGITGLPTTLVLSSSGEILGKMVGNPDGTYDGYVNTLKSFVSK